MQTLVFTIFAKNYLPHARALMDSVMQRHPDLGRAAILVDRPDGYFDPLAERFEIVPSEDLPIEESRRFHFKYSLLELSTAVKPYATQYLLDRYGPENIVYFDPDILLYSSLDSILGRLKTHSFLLTPHITSPLGDDRRPTELDILRSGAFNLGFMALRDCAESRGLLSWWKCRLQDHCRVDLANGLFVDQKWLDLAPGLFPGMGIVRDPGCNVAYWNLSHRRVECLTPQRTAPQRKAAENVVVPDEERTCARGGGKWLVNGEPLVFFHFSGFDAERPEAISRHQNRFELASLEPAARFLYQEYAAALLQRGYAECKDWPYAYGVFADGSPIPDVVRQRYEAIEPTADPFSEKGQLDFIHSMACCRADGGLGRLAAGIYRSRSDVRNAFPNPEGEDRERFLRWLLTYGAAEYGLGEAFLRPFREDWEEAVLGISNPLARLKRRSMLALAKRRVKGAASRRPQKIRTRAAFGINFVGYVRSEMGVGESVRCAVRAAKAAGTPVRVKSVDWTDGPFRLQDRSVAEDREFPYAFNIFHVNADQSPEVLAQLGEKFTRGKFNIGYWAWELEEFPTQWEASFRYFQEIWTPSFFCAEAIARVSPAPVLRVPHAIHPGAVAALDRAAFGLPQNAFVFLCVFDLMSGFERKNPLGAIAALRAAFQGSDRYHLALKINHAERHSDRLEQIRNAAQGLPVTILARTMDRADVAGLMNCCDCLISLHRSEGFGLTLAEAMFFGKPVIATAYSGNLDFTREDNSFLVRFQMTTVPPGCEPYRQGARWADPDVSHAAEQMRLVAQSAAARVERARRGQQFVRSELAAPAVGEIMKRRLELLRARLK
ncbi:MAG TPA: glycosyltransferase [Bryobacteraceae bacterium]|nr:glycosyltransferase [Bryobacteraceae bacterium]